MSVFDDNVVFVTAAGSDLGAATTTRFAKEGPAVAATALFLLLALGVIWTVMPETASRELEETLAVSGHAMLPSDGKRTCPGDASRNWSCRR
jgi:NAD(P)-dependent dehydrogenase (short-subunit alcohol dehydrogenase family)